MNWVIKAVGQKMISFLPYSTRINYLFQRYITIGKELPFDLVRSRIILAKEHLCFYQKYEKTAIDNAKITEIGTGWYPIVPIYLYLHGANYISTVDVKQLYTNDSIDKAIRAILNCIETGEMESYFIDISKERVENLKSALSEKNIEQKFLVFNTISQIENNCLKNVESYSQDLIVSNNTFQYIPECELSLAFSEIKRISKRNSIISIFIDFTDHFSQSDLNLNPYHFLKYSDKKWKLITSNLQPQNRLRKPYFSKLFEKENILVLEEKNSLGSSEKLSEIPLNKKFSQYSHSEIAITHCHFVAKILNE